MVTKARRPAVAMPHTTDPDSLKSVAGLRAELHRANGTMRDQGELINALQGSAAGLAEMLSGIMLARAKGDDERVGALIDEAIRATRFAVNELETMPPAGKRN